ncbi:tyrosine-type recombinase/integrase [Chitinivibrio alkaliphilus]|uniref:Tyrosine recombinase XerD n=1 Tax=Chitinivibrio alkaliphilus ACht1 TaxID=1313304 RepID=U7D9K7_9BACT|nr:tyrosine-type recombinase/integrase [Chitinivibrio alkaliphilus]ERP31772.1 tyrosine recombinase XerD [Chitinivibrio alkaliphilus ACht1]
MEIHRCLEEFLRSLRHHSKHTRDAYKRDLESFIAEGKTLCPSSPPHVQEILHRSVVRHVLHTLHTMGNSPATIRRKRAALQSFITFCLLRSYLSTDPLASLGSPKNASRCLPGIIEERHTAALQHMKYSGPQARRNQALIELFYGSGLRLSELHRANIGDIEWEKGLIRVVGKGEKTRIVPTTPQSLSCLMTYLTQDRGTKCKDAPLFTSTGEKRLSRRQIERIVKKVLHHITDEDSHTPHTLRHTYASHLLDHGADIRVVKELLGHSSLDTTQIYTHLSKQRIAQAFHQAHPRSGKRT